MADDPVPCPTCPNCNNPMRLTLKHNRLYCDVCQNYTKDLPATGIPEYMMTGEYKTLDQASHTPDKSQRGFVLWIFIGIGIGALVALLFFMFFFGR